MIEAYRLVLTHYAVDKETGERIRLDLPISIEQIFERQDCENVGIPIILNKMLDEMKTYILLKADEVEE